MKELKLLPFREGSEPERLQLIWEIYSYLNTIDYAPWKHVGNITRNRSVSWDLCHIFAAISGGYKIELSPYFKGVQAIRKNKQLWNRVSPYVNLDLGGGLLPGDSTFYGIKWDKLNGM